MKKILVLYLKTGIISMILCSSSYFIRIQPLISAENFYEECMREGRVYIFTSPAQKAAFEKSGELGKEMIIKIGHGPNGETMVFDSDEAVIEYESRQIKKTLEQLNINAYKMIERDGRFYVFTSPSRKTDFDKSGEPGKGAIIKVGYGPKGETVVFDSPEAVKEYDNRNPRNQEVKISEASFYHELRKDNRLYIFTSVERKAEFEESGEVGKSIIKIGYGPNGETVVFDSDEAVTQYDVRVKK
ncbi:MAG: hypothetical protein A2W17_01150 [Planctomycetes bacterium RBG_16_41_13]|nr:MAG: hypothetical protein A2W17_01150 [Planctomycetes bacterium RBG_16_41_13]